MKYLDINSLFACAVIVANKAGMCGLWFKGQDEEPGWVPFPDLPQCIGEVIKTLCTPISWKWIITL